jgi:hypothetical protein
MDQAVELIRVGLADDAAHSEDVLGNLVLDDVMCRGKGIPVAVFAQGEGNVTELVAVLN